MYRFQIRYRNTQGTLMRILTAVSRRGLDLPYVLAEPRGSEHVATLLLDVNPRQVAQLGRDWRAIVDVIDVCEVAEPLAPEARGAHRPSVSASSQFSLQTASALSQ